MTSHIAAPVRVRVALRLTALVAILSAIAASAHADYKEEAKRFFEEGKSLFIDKQYAEAAVDFRASLDLYPTYNSFYNLANCHKALRRYQEALAVIEEMKRRMPGALPADIQVKFEELDQSIRAVAGTLDIHVTPDGADILIDGDRLGTSPLASPLLLTPGYHTIECGAKGFTASRQNVLVITAETATLRIALTPLPALLRVVVGVDGADVTVDGVFTGKTPLKSPLSLPPGQHIIAVSKTGYEKQSLEVSLVSNESTMLEIKPVPLPVKSVELAEKSRSKIPRVLFWSGIAATVVSTAGFAGFLVPAANLEESFNKNDKKYLTATDKTDIALYDEKRRDDRDQGIAFSRAAMGFGIAASVFAAATIAAGVLGRDRHKAAERAVFVAPCIVSVRF